jgi:hypothetical protein
VRFEEGHVELVVVADLLNELRLRVFDESVVDDVGAVNVLEED